MKNRFTLLVPIFVVLAIACSSAGAAAETPNLLQARDVFELEYASDPQISPDGRRIVYVRTSMDIMTDRPRGNLWIVATEGSSHRPLISGRDSLSAPRWSPDGGRIAYVSGAEGSPQLYVRWLDSGQTALLTNLAEAPSGLSWSPDGEWIAFSRFVKEKRPPLAEPPEKPEGAKWAPPVKVIESTYYRSDGQGFLESGYSHIFVVPADGGTPRQLTSGNFNHGGGLSWLPDGSEIVFSANRNEDWESDPAESELYAVALDGGAIRALTQRDGPDDAPAVSPDGRWIAYAGLDDRRQGYQLRRLYLMDTRSGETKAISGEFDRRVGDPQWSGDSRRIFFDYDDRGVRKLGMVRRDAGEVSIVADGLGGATLGRPYTSGSFTVSANGTLALTQGDATRPADIATGRGDGRLRRLTDLNSDLLGARDLARVVELNWKSSFDQRDIQGWLALPPGYQQGMRYPLILEIHGGPFAAYGPNFSAEVQLYAAAGYVVLYTNPRGSSSYGEEFGNLIHHAYPSHDYDDLMSGVDAAIERGYADGDQLYVTGGSGGGVLTAWIVGKTVRFRAAVVAKPVINWVSFVLTSDGYPFFTRYWFPAMPWEDPEHYWARSPLSLVGNVETPTMLLTGEADYRTPISESEQYYQALKLRGIDTALVRVPEASHGIAGRPSQLIAKVDNILAWFARYAPLP